MKLQNQNKVFEDFYRTHRAFVRSLCSQYVSRSEDSMDIESIVWMEVYKIFHVFNVETPRPLLRRVVKWRVKDFYRRALRSALSGHDWMDDWGSSNCARLGLSEQVGRPEEWMDLHGALRKEAPETIHLLVRRFVEGYSWKELAEEFNLHRNTLLYRTHIAIERLRSQMEQPAFECVGHGAN